MVSGVMSTFSALTLLTALITPGFAAEGACKAGNEPECFAKSGTDGVGMVQRRVNISKHEEASEIPPVALLNGNYTRNADAAQQTSTCAGFDYAAYPNTLTLTAVVEMPGETDLDKKFPEGTLMAFGAGLCAGLFPNPDVASQKGGWDTLLRMPPFCRCCFKAPMFGMTLYTAFPGWMSYSFKFQPSDGTMIDLRLKGTGFMPPWSQPGAEALWLLKEENYANVMLPIIFEPVPKPSAA